jgi:hypothetical protein
METPDKVAGLDASAWVMEGALFHAGRVRDLSGRDDRKETVAFHQGMAEGMALVASRLHVITEEQRHQIHQKLRDATSST